MEEDINHNDLSDSEFEIILLTWARLGISYKQKLKGDQEALLRAFRIRATESYRSAWKNYVDDLLLDIEEEVIHCTDFNELRSQPTFNGGSDLAPNDLKRAISKANQKRWILERRNEQYRVKETKKLETDAGIKVEVYVPAKEEPTE